MLVCNTRVDSDVLKYDTKSSYYILLLYIMCVLAWEERGRIGEGSLWQEMIGVVPGEDEEGEEWLRRVEE